MFPVKEGIRIYQSTDSLPDNIKDGEVVFVLDNNGGAPNFLISRSNRWFELGSKPVEVNSDFDTIHTIGQTTDYTNFDTEVKKQLPYFKLLARPITGKCAEQLVVVDAVNVNEGEITNKYKTDKLDKMYMCFFLDNVYKMTIECDVAGMTPEEIFNTKKKQINYAVLYDDKADGGTCNYCFTNASRNWNTGQKFSKDDGGWAMVPGDLDFNSPGPYLNNYSSGAYGFGNINSNDNSANKLYINNTNKSGTVKAFIYVTLQ